MIPQFPNSLVKVVSERVRSTAMLLLPLSLMAIILFSIGCSDETETESNKSANAAASASPGAGTPVSSAAATPLKPIGGGTIKATPNPVPAGQGGGRTRITWKTTGDEVPVEVYVVQDSQPEVKFSQGAEGAVDAPWIAAGSTYEFRLYAGSGAGRKLLALVQVTRTP